MYRTLKLGLFAAILFVPGIGSAEEFFFKDGDKVVMIGDSITEQHLYSNFVETWTTTRFPNWKITFRNVGIGGDRSPGGNDRFARDVAFFKPTALTVPIPSWRFIDWGQKFKNIVKFGPSSDGAARVSFELPD